MILRAAYASAHSRAITPGHRCVFSLAMYHVFGYIECMLAVSFVGGAVVPQLVFDPADMLNAVSRHQLDEMVAVPTMTFALLDEARANSYDLSTLTIMYSSGGAAPASIWSEINEVFQPEEVAMGYGQTETTAAATRYFPEDPDEMLTGSHGKFRPAGIAGDLAEYKTIDLVTGRDLPRGEQGELMVRGLTEAALIAHCKSELARFKVPAHVLFVDVEDLPLTVTARVQKFRLVEMAQDML
jgi:fatty-acyl-CoA synthase